MQAKGFIKFIIIGLLVFALYQLSYTFLGRHFQNKAKVYGIEQAKNFSGSEAEMEAKNAEMYYLDSLKNEQLVNLGFTELTYEDINKQQLKLGLDLKGGISMLVEIDNADILNKLSHESEDTFFNQAIKLTQDNENSSQEGFIDAFASNYNKVSNGASLAAIFAPYEEFKGKVDWKDSNADVIKAIKEEVESKWAETHNILSTRIDQFGVANPFISKPDQKGRIYIELPGADDSKRIRNIIQTSALLEFYKVYELRDVDKLLGNINDVVRTKLGLDEVEEVTAESIIEEATVTNIDTVVNDLGELSDLGDLSNNTVSDDSAESSQVNPFYEIFSPNYGKKGEEFFYNEGPIIGYALKRDLPTINNYFGLEEVKALLPRDLRFMWSAKAFKKADGTFSDTYMLYAIKTLPTGGANVSGEVIVDAYNSKDPMGQDVVGMSMNGIGAKKWADLTRECNPTGDQNAGKSIAIVLDNKVFSAPRSNGEITGGSSQISGMDDLQEAQDLANILKSGKLDAKINIPQEAVVGASLGKASISSGLLSLVTGFLLVILFMFLYYSGAGLIANIALLVNVVLIMGALTSLRAALTLPGIAGIVLTIGMAVDANVIIFERIREELRKGKGLKLAVSDGFSHSYSAIIDANMTTLIAGVVLLMFGAGAVKGFAIVLIIGIVASFISAVFLSRLIFDWWLTKDKSISFANPFSDNILTNSNFDFIGKRKMFYTISGVIILTGLFSIFTTGFELGVDFKGGRSYVIEFDQAVSNDAIRAKLSTEFGEEATVKKYDVDSKVQIITAYKIEDKSKTVDSIIVSKLYSGLEGFYKEAPTKEAFALTSIIQANKVDTSIADDIKVSAFEAGSLGALFIFIYILIRFRRWQYGAGAIIAVLHDVLIILSIFSIFKGILPFSLEIEQKFIAAILTVIGYSINDTVVVFDRVREFIAEHPSRDYKSNINTAINSTLSRTLITSFTTFLVVALMFVFGGPAIKGFSFALLIGVIVGTYSSIFIAAAILVDTWSVSKKISSKKK